MSQEECNTSRKYYADSSSFLLVKLQVIYLLSINDVQERRACLTSLPPEVFEAYELLLTRVSRGNQRFTFKILSWILQAKRPLTIAEIREAIAVLDNMPELPKELNEPQTIRECCQGLAVVNEDGTMALIHQTVGEFLRQQHGKELLKSSDLAKVCVTYLGFDVFDQICDNGIAMLYRLDQYRFSDYAAQYWSKHVNDSEDVERVVDLEDAILTTFKSFGKRESMEQIKQRDGGQHLYMTWHGKSLLHILIENRLASIFMSPLGTATKMFLFSVFAHAN